MMMDQPDAVADPKVPIVSFKLALSEEARASLETVRVAQELARGRARRQTVQTRIRCATLVGAVALAALLAPRLARLRHARVQASLSAPTSPIPSAPATPVPAAEPALSKASETSVRKPEPSVMPATEQPAAAGKAKAGDVVGSDEGCDAASIRTASWRLSPAACARAFEADPSNASLALAVAQAEHAHGRLAEAAQWAKRALALDPNAAEAYVLVARDELEKGRGEDARTAYRRYLALAPRGWHQAEARAALRRPRR